MAAKFFAGNVHASCPDWAGSVTSFEYRVGGAELGAVAATRRDGAGPLHTLLYHLMKCASCGRGGVAVVRIAQGNNYSDGELTEFWPISISSLPIPEKVPSGVKSEFREAELCASVGAWRAGSSLLRSTLEKTLRANGYDRGSLADRIDQAAADGAITAARSKRAHDDIRVLGNDVLHDEWREVTEDEFNLAHHYTQRILEDFYDDRPSVEALLIEKGRLKAP
jgi:hypothetical protein